MSNMQNILEMAPAFHSMMENFYSKNLPFTSKYDRAKVSIETESRTLLPLLISYENLHMSENTVTLTHKQNNETSRTGKGKYFTLGRCSRIRETYMYQSWMYVPMDVSAQGLYLLQPSVPS